MTKIICCVLLLVISFASGATNLLKDADFEKSAGDFTTQSYWSGEMERVSGAGIGHASDAALRLTTALKGEVHFVRVMVKGKFRDVSFRKYRFSIWAKGQGKLHLGSIKYITPAEGKPPYIYDLQEEGALLTADWQQYSYLLDFSRERINSIAPIVEVRGEGEALLDDAMLELAVVPGATLSFSDSHQIIPLGNVPTLSCQYSQPDSILFLNAQFNQEPAKQLELPLPTDGKAIVPEEICRQTSVGRLALSASAGGLSAKLFLQYVAPEDFSAAQELASKVVLPKAIHILYLGDSLSDFDRGFNYPDKVNFWLNYNNPSKATFHNAGVGGDFISRVNARLKGQKTHRPEMYADIFAAPADYIFLFLGQNDTKASSRHNYTVPVVPPEAQEKLYREVISQLRDKSQARLVLLSAASTMADLCRQSTEKRVATGKVANMFGQPQHIEAFNAVLKKLAQELDLDYIDIYTPMQQHPDKSTLFLPSDGVHLTELGHTFVAKHILNYLITGK